MNWSKLISEMVSRNNLTRQISYQLVKFVPLFVVYRSALWKICKLCNFVILVYYIPHTLHNRYVMAKRKTFSVPKCLSSVPTIATAVDQSSSDCNFIDRLQKASKRVFICHIGSSSKQLCSNAGEMLNKISTSFCIECGCICCGIFLSLLKIRA